MWRSVCIVLLPLYECEKSLPKTMPEATPETATDTESKYPARLETVSSPMMSFSAGCILATALVIAMFSSPPPEYPVMPP